MANLTASNLVKAQVILNQNFQNPELRRAESPILSLGTKGSNFLMQNPSELRLREDRPIEANILKRNKRTTIGVGRTHDHAGAIGDSITKQLLWTSFTDKFSFSLKMLDNNLFDTNTYLANQFSQAFQNIREDIELFLIDLLLAELSQVNNGHSVGAFNDTDFVFEIPATADKGLFFENAKAMMRQNDYTGMYDVITDPLAYVMARYYAAQGAANAQNTSFQFSGMNIMESNTLAIEGYTNGLALFLPSNSFGVLDWIPKQNREGNGDYNTVLGGFGSMTDPVTGLVHAVHGYATRANTTSSNGNAQDVKIEFEVSIDISPNLAPLSNPDETVVFAVANE